MATEETLGRTLLRALDALQALIPNAKPEDLPALQARRAALLAQIERLVDTNLDQGTQEYAAATAALQAASNSIRDAIGRIERVAAAIQMLGKALELVAKLAPA